MSKIRIKPLLFWVLGTLAVGALSGFISMGAMEDFERLVQPPLSPPGWLFPVVWSILYLLMGISAYLIWVAPCSTGERNGAIFVYCMQLAVNFFWSLIFFNAGAYLPALIWLILLIVLVAVMLVRFRRISRPATYLNIPYFIWLLFAAYLNAGVWVLNR